MQEKLLTKGSKVALFCSGSRCQSAAELIQAEEFLQQKYTLQATYDSAAYCYTPPLQRAELFFQYLTDPSVKALLAMRGGEGTADMLPFLHQLLQQAPVKLSSKLIMGYSDITSLLLYFAQEYNWQVVHGGGMLRFSNGSVSSTSIETTFALLFGRIESPSIALTPLNLLAEKNELINAQITGGNLSLLALSSGELWQLNASNKILIIEDVNEKAHKIFRMLKHLQRTGFLTGVRAIIFGDFNCQAIGVGQAEQDFNRTAITTQLGYFAKAIDIPVFSSQDFGHGENNMPIMFNREYELSMNCLKISVNAAVKV
ncbi:MAG: LD-carboxypeptidase [Gammaproteobacteria bacterium]|nr:LD-carboxypeptidase [Gammaproteobacteria bacterium]